MIRNTIGFPDDVYRRIRAQANANRRSIAAEVVVLVEEALTARQVVTIPLLGGGALSLPTTGTAVEAGEAEQ